MTPEALADLRRLSIDRCPEHGTYGISINDGSHGTRLTRSKCCGRWAEVVGWYVNATDLHEMANELQCEALSLEDEK